MEHSPSLRVRPFRQPPFQVQFPLPIAPAPAMDDIPSNTDRPRRGMFRLPRVRQPVNLVLPGQHRQAEAHRQAGNAGEEGEQQGMPEELPDTPEAPRAATATQNQATADELFEAAVSESAAHASEAAAGGQGIQAEPSWLDDAAAYDAAAAEIETDGLAALEILSDSGDDDDGDASVHGARSTAAPALALTSLHQLVLSSDSEDESSMADSDVVADSDVMSDSAPLPANSDTPQHIRLRLLQRALRPRGAAEQHEQAASLSSAATAAASLVASGLSAVASARADQPASSVMNVADSPPPSSARHIGMPRAVLSDVTSSFPPQQQQQEDPPAAPAADKPCNLQRRRLVCREPAQSLLTAPDQLASSSSSAGGTSAGLSPEAQLHSVQDVTSPVAVARCTRSQVRRNKQPSTSQQALLAGSRVAEQALSNAAAVASHVRAAGSNDSQVQAGSNVVAQQSAGLNRPQRQIKNRPRLQLNRVAKHD